MIATSKNYLCEICKFQCRSFEEWQTHIHKYHEDIEKREKARKSSSPPPNTLRDGTPAPQRITTMTPEELLAKNLEMSALVQKAYGVRREGNEIILTKEFKKISDIRQLRVRGALGYLDRRLVIREEE